MGSQIPNYLINSDEINFKIGKELYFKHLIYILSIQTPHNLISRVSLV